MKIPVSWLAEWVQLPWPAAELGARLTMAGFELEALAPAAPPFTGVVVAEIVSAEPHPQADRLRVCRVSRGAGEPLQIVCGATNARAGLKTALAQVGAVLPGEMRIGAATLRGVMSQGMLASAKELGLAESSNGILELPEDAPVGRDLRAYLDLDDSVLELNVTPNRGDAMSMLGIAREVAALAGTVLRGPPLRTAAAQIPDRLAVQLDAPEACPRFAGCVLRSVDNARATPVWMRERLRRAGVRSISPVVDVTNYVMRELGQPMHAYDLAKLKGGIRVRHAHAGEQITLLDGRGVSAEADVLLITDADGPVGLAGIMGGARTAVSPETTTVFLEAAHFTPAAIAGRGRRYGLVTDAGQRFERGVDPALPQRALERARELLAGITGAQSGAVVLEDAAGGVLSARSAVRLRRAQLTRLLGLELPAERVGRTLSALGLAVTETADGWLAQPPSWRFDLSIEADLIEEVARIVGYDAIPEAAPRRSQSFPALPEGRPPERIWLEALAMRGYHEAVTFAFVDPALQAQLFPHVPALALANPIASDLGVMRVSLWPGLLRAAQENQRRQQSRVRLVEHASRFESRAQGGIAEIDTLAGLALGPRAPEQWGLPEAVRGPADFYDVKGDLEALFQACGGRSEYDFRPETLGCLHPGRAARILRGGTPVGWIGELHPTLVKALDFTYAPVLFELDVATALEVRRPAYREVSRFPQVRRDLALVVDESVTLCALTERVTLTASSLLQNLVAFDVYRGPGVEPGRKSVALGLIFQDISRTLRDDEVEALMASIVADLRASLNARVRE